jgi:hypothetical protein
MLTGQMIYGWTWLCQFLSPLATSHSPLENE